ncbi:MAG: hypothetical protein ONB48_05465 [candidate division KSB1 bacterium]|nr:hypothetical protein [candidate division KSB1 bacterium]MDZ7272995.1 hypothetical protein [candidate division KSB1 bacterium]MDZ7285098.1 hypothetical protein [candidate division KSB1 bacterium]MDZ7298130.1 hypothetical protein [candidate division KSB1 bacterium]MDZ7309353.1 hypothetical protein [candidate division KSB1 bacterium]
MNKLRTALWMAFYNLLAIPFLFVLFHLVATLLGRTRTGAKIRLGRQGRAHLFAGLAEQMAAFPPDRPRFWLHAASLGECEQAKPILLELGRHFPHSVRVLTVFSPSAYQNLSRQNLPAEVMCYLPIDTLTNARRFLALVNPAAGVVIRHDYWPNFIWQARRRGVFLLLANASVSANAATRRYWPGVRHFHREILANFAVIAAVSPAAAESLQPLLRHPERLRILGDTRYDQVLLRAQQADLGRILPANWRPEAPVLVAGSTWPSDEEVLLPAFVAARQQVPGLRMILVPHEPTAAHLAGLEQRFQELHLPAARLSQPAAAGGAAILLVDRIGVLAELYGAGQIAFVGGSFGPGVHSVLEAAAHGIPVLFGPRMNNSPEALEMKNAGLGRVVTDVATCTAGLLALLQDPAVCRELGRQCRAFVAAKAGATARIVDLLQTAGAAQRWPSPLPCPPHSP